MLLLLLLLLCLARPAPASYRHISLPALCRRQQPAARKAARVLLEEGGAAVLSLRQDDARPPYWRCDLELRAEPGFGLMAHLETASLRPDPVRRGQCQDYLQLGRDDNMPFFTWDKSRELCGDTAPGTSFDVPNGQLLVWVRLGGLAGLETSGLSLVVTPYLREDGASVLTNYRACADGGRFIRRGYFCDGRVNCAADGSPADESPASCGSGTGPGGEAPAPAPPGPRLNLLTVTLLLASAALLLLALLLVAVRLHRRRHCCLSAPAPELPDRADSRPGLLPPGPPRAHALLRRPASPPPPSPPRGTTPDSESEPPPAYCDLYPGGYTPEGEKTEPRIGSSYAEEPA